MIASSIVAKVNRMNPDWQPAQILDVLNDVHTMCFKRESVHLIHLDPTTGDLPYLSTTAGTFLYNVTIPGTPIWKIAEIVIDFSQAVPDTSVDQSYDRYQREYDMMSRKYRCVPTRKEEAVGNQPVQVTFLFDPGTQSSLYKIAGYESPPVISALSQSLMWHDHQVASVIACVQGLLDAQDNGRFAEAWADVQDKWLPELVYDNEKDDSPVFAQNYGY